MATYNCSLKDVLAGYWDKVWMKAFEIAYMPIILVLGGIWFFALGPVSRDVDQVPFYLVVSAGVTLFIIVISVFVARVKVSLELHGAVFRRLFKATPQHTMGGLSHREEMLVMSILGLHPTVLEVLRHLPADSEDRIAALATTLFAAKQLDRLTTWHVIMIYWRGFLRSGI